jgi:uncharacterized OsmC-like protein
MYSAAITNKGDSRHYASTKDYNFVIDTEGKGAHPIDTLLASLCGCIGHYVRDYMRERRIACEGFTVTAEAEAARDKLRLSDIRVSIDLKGTPLDGHSKVELLKYVEHCKVHNTLKANSSIRIFFNDSEETGQ